MTDVPAPGGILSRHVSALRVAVQFLTTLPVGRLRDYSGPVVGLSLLYYPLVGALLGSILLASLWLGSLWLSPALVAALTLLLWVGLTGALHLDGLADCADAWVGGLGDRARTLALMKDPTSGPMAIGVLVLVLLLKWALLNEWLLRLMASEAAVGNPWVSSGLLMTLMLTPVLARLAPLWLFLSTPYVRKAGLGEVLVAHFSRRAAQIGTLLLIAGLVWLDWARGCGLGMGLLVVSGLTLWGLRRLMLRRLGGCTGDTVGATVELLEVALLFAGLLLMPVSPLDMGAS